MKNKIVLLGAGGWSIALAKALYKNEHDVNVWSALESEINEIERDRARPSVLSGVSIPDGIKTSADIEVCRQSDFVVIATAAKFVAQTARRLCGIIDENTVIISVAKGLDPNTNRRLSEVINAALPQNKVAVLSGPSHAEEVSRSVPTALVSASASFDASERVAKLFRSDVLRVYLSSDVVGVELGGVIKNVIAVAAGIIDGMGYGDNTKAALMTRAIVEMSRLGEKLGGKKQTFAGLTGIGDLIVTCTSMHSRNRRCGILIGQGVPVEEAIKRFSRKFLFVAGVVELLMWMVIRQSCAGVQFVRATMQGTTPVSWM